MDTNKLKEEIKLLERKLELLEQINRLQAIPAYPAYPSYPIYPAYPQPIYPLDRVIYSGGTTTIPCETITAHNGPATSDSTMIKEGDQVTYTI